MKTVSPLVGVLLTNVCLQIAQGALQCICTTVECQQEKVTVCTAANMCYTQVYRQPLGGSDARRSGGYVTRVTRGCIDVKTPLLCENKPPQMGRRADSLAWPLLHCCRGDMCNDGPLPTSTTTTTSPRTTVTSPQTSPYLPPVYYGGERRADEYHNYRTRDRRKPSTIINPLYIGVPIAGACVLLGFAIFVIYIVRCQAARRDTNYHGCHDHRVVKAPPPLPPGNHGNIMTKSGVRGQDTSSSERSPSGSETKLLMKV